MLLATQQKPIDPLELREAFGSFVTGVTVVSTLDASGNPRGLTANSFTSVSLDPPLLLVCLDNKAASREVFESASSFSISILGAGQRQVSNTFASKSPNKFETICTFTATTGAPLIQDAIAWFDCVKDKWITAGDHVLLVGRVVDFRHDSGTPLAYCRGSYIDFGLEQKAVGTGRSLMYGCIANVDDSVLLEHDPIRDQWSIPLTDPKTSAVASEHAPGGLPLVLRELGAEVDLSFLYSVFDERDETIIVYRGGMAGPPCKSRRAAMFTEATLPWDQISTPQIRNMLRRYFVERVDDRFGIYMDSGDGGRVAMIDGKLTPFAQHSAAQK
jgi:flavin reductase (DIM6/NTAB) family NADH-FMN oxidoreductase RutF